MSQLTWFDSCLIVKRSLSHAQLFDAFYSVFYFFLFLIFVKGEKNSFSILANLNTKIFFYKIKAGSSLHTCVKFYFRRVCRTQRFPIVYKTVIKNKFPANFFFVFFVSLKLEIFFHHLQNVY